MKLLIVGLGSMGKRRAGWQRAWTLPWRSRAWTAPGPAVPKPGT